MNGRRFYLKDINPLAGLTEYRLAGLFAEAQRGAYATTQWLFSFVERRNPTARAVKRRLLSALGKLDWDIKTADCGEDVEKQAQADAQAETLRAAYDRVRNLRAALTFLSLADLRGYSHLEKIYRGGKRKPKDGAPEAENADQKKDTGDPWDIIELRPVEQWFWVRDGIYGAWEYNGSAQSGTYRGTAVELGQFIIREVDDPACEIFAKVHVRQEASDSDWDGYLERFGIPSVIVEGPPNVPPEKEAEYQAQAEGIASDASGYIPNGAKVHTVAAGAGSSVFKERLEFLDGQIVIAGTSGKLTILSESGSGTLAGGAQADAFDDVAEALAQQVSETMQEGFDREVLERAHPGEPVLAYFEYAPVSEEDGSKALTDAGLAFSAGYLIDLAELSEKSGYKLTRLPAVGNGTQGTNGTYGPGAGDPSAVVEKVPTLQPAADPSAVVEKAPAVPPAADPSAAVEKALRVTPGFLAPAAAVIEALLANAADGEITDAEFIAFAEQLLAELPALAETADVSGVADALEQAMRTAVETTLQG